jgi:hypothetical protein
MNEIDWLIGKGLLILVLVAVAYFLYGWCSMYSHHRKWGGRVVLVLLALAFVVALAGCPATVQPVRYQAVPMVTVKPCLAGKPLPAEASVRTQPVCEKARVDCLVDARADIEDLKREAEASRRLLKECSK